jgi:outer membrane murein-binding lipoprotein Lpp
MLGFFIFAICVAFAILFLRLAAKRNTIDALERTVNRLHSRADEDESRLEYYRKEIDRSQEHSRRSAEEITRMAVQYEVDQERAARDARLRNARDAAEAIRARIGGKA